jgi:hypothetical protein
LLNTLIREFVEGGKINPAVPEVLAHSPPDTIQPVDEERLLLNNYFRPSTKYKSEE